MPALTSLLARDEVVSIHKIEEALQRQVLEGGEIDTVLLELNAAHENVLNAYRAAVFGLRPASRHELMSVGPETMRVLPRELAERYRAVPLSIHASVLSLAVSTPLSEEGMRHVSESCGLRLEIRIATEVRVEAALAAHYGIAISGRMRALALQLEKRDPGALAVVPPLEEAEVDHFDDDFLDELWAEAASSEEMPVGEVDASAVPAQPDVASGRDPATPEQAGRRPGEPELVPGGFTEGPTLTGIVQIPPGQPQETTSGEVAQGEALQGSTVETEAQDAVGLSRVLGVGGHGPSVGVGPERDDGAEVQPGVGRQPALMQSPLPKPRSLVPRGPLTPGVARELLRNAQTRDEVVEVFFSFTRQYFDCAVLFSFRQDSVLGLASVGLVGVGDVRQISIPLDEGSVLIDVRRSLLSRVVDLSRRQEDLRVAYALGRTTAQPSLLMPVYIRQRPVLLFYGDRAGERFTVDEVSDLVEMLPSVARAFERAIQAQKVLTTRAGRVHGAPEQSAAERSGPSDESSQQVEPEGESEAKPEAGLEEQFAAKASFEGEVERPEKPRRKSAKTLPGLSDEQAPGKRVRARQATLAGIGQQPSEPSKPGAAPDQADVAETRGRPVESSTAEQALSVLGVRPSQPLAAPPDVTQPLRRSTQRLQVSSFLVPKRTLESERAAAASEARGRDTSLGEPADDAAGAAAEPAAEATKPALAAPIGVGPPAPRRSTLMEIDGVDKEHPAPEPVTQEPQDPAASRSRDTLRGDACLDLPPAQDKPPTEQRPPDEAGPDEAEPGEASADKAPADEPPDHGAEQGPPDGQWPSRQRVETKDYVVGELPVERTAAVGQPAEPPAEGLPSPEEVGAAHAPEPQATLGDAVKAAGGAAAQKDEARRATEPLGLEAVAPPPGAGQPGEHPSKPSSDQPSVIVDMGSSQGPEERSIDALLTSLCAARAEDVEPVVMALVRAGDEVLPELVRRFPGPLWFDRGQLQRGLPRGRDVSPLARAIFSFGENALPFVRSLLHAGEADVRLCAVLLAGDMPDSGLLEPIAELLFDADTEMRGVAGSVLRRYRGVRGFGKVLKSLRGVAAGPGASTDWRVMAIEALAALRDTGGLDVLLAQLKDSLKQVSEAAHNALVTITVQDFGLSVGKWTSWIERNQGRDRVEWLIDSLTHSDETIRSAAGAELQQLSQEYYGYHPTSSSKRDRERVQQKYREWWDVTRK